MYPGTRNYRDEIKYEDINERLRRNASVLYPEGSQLSSFHSSSGQELPFSARQNQYTSSQITTTTLGREPYLPLHNPGGTGAHQISALSLLPLATQQERYLSGQNTITRNPESLLPSFYPGLIGRDRLTSLSPLPLVTHMQQNQYTSRQNVGIIDPLSYMSYHAGGSGTDLIPSSSLVTRVGPFNSDLLALRYGANVSSTYNLQAQSNPFFPRCDASTPLLTHDLSMQHRLRVERDLLPSLSATSVSYLSNSNQLLKQQEYDALRRNTSVSTPSCRLETEYSRFEKWFLSPTTNIASHIEESERFSLRKTRSPSFECKVSGSRKRYHSPSSSLENSPVEKREYRFSPRKADCSSHETRSLRNEERHHSPIHSNESPPREIKGYRFSSTKETDISSRENKSRSRERHRSPVHRNRSPLKGKRDHRFSSTGKTDNPQCETKSFRSREKNYSPARDGRGLRTEKRDHDSGTNTDKPRESRYIVDKSNLAKMRTQEEHKNTSSKTGDDKKENNATSSRALRCYCLPEPKIQRILSYRRSDKFYKSDNLSSTKSTFIATEEVVKLHREFEEMLSPSDVVSTQTHCQNTSDASNPVDAIDSLEEDTQYVWKLLDKLEGDGDDSNADGDGSEAGGDGSNGDGDGSEASGGDEDDSELELDGYFTVDESDSDSSTTSEDSQKSRPGGFLSTRCLAHPKRLDPELWFNVAGELNHGRECLCSTQDKEKWIVHNVYPIEKKPPACETLGNNGLQLYHYWVTVYPHTNFMTENPTRIESDGRAYTFEGFSLLSHSPLDAVPRCNLTRFNINYEIIFLQEPIPTNFCIKDLDLFSKFLFHEILEMFDWDISNKGNEDHCNLFHFLPRFTRKIGVSSDGSEKHELLPMRKVFQHLLNSRKPLIQDAPKSSDKNAWEEFVGYCANSLVTKPGWKPSSLRVDDIERPGRDEKGPPMIVHHGIRPVQLSFSGNPKCQKLFRSYLKFRNSIMNRPDSTEKERLKLIKMKLTLDNMKMKDSLRRDCCIRVSADGMLKTGLNSDVTQHALLLPVLVHHVRHHLCLQTFEEKIDYVFKDRTLLQLALTHPSYVMNYGTNPDHARNSLSNCGVKKPRYGDKRNRFKHIKKKGIVHLIDIMAKLEDLEGSQSFIQHNERLEFLGDAILEFICTSHLYFLFPEMNEGSLVAHRSSLVQNRQLSCVAKKLELDTFMRFSHGPDLCHEDDMDHAMANCLEALLGAIYLDSDVNTVRKVFCQLAFDESELRELWGNLDPHPLQTHQPRGDRHFISSSDVLKKLVKFEESVGVMFSHIRLLARAFTHPQVGFNNLTLGNNQRMELLGDSVVQWVVTDYLYSHFPEHHEGHLTLLRSSLVNRNIQADIAGEIGLNHYVNFGVGHTVPKLRQKHMADLFEAFLAALFVDKGVEPVKLFCKVCLFPRLRDVILNQEWLDAKSQLQSCCITQARRWDVVPVYKVLKNVGSPNMKLYTVGVYFKGQRLGTGDGDNVREAEMNAAQDALAKNYFPEYVRQKRVLNQKHKHIKS